jgi:hypothetical protein
MNVKDLIAALTSFDPTDEVLLCVDGSQAHVQRVRTVSTRPDGHGPAEPFVHVGDHVCRTLEASHHGIAPSIHEVLPAPDVVLTRVRVACDRCEGDHDPRAVAAAKAIHDDSNCTCKDDHHGETVDTIESHYAPIVAPLPLASGPKRKGWQEGIEFPHSYPGIIDGEFHGTSDCPCGAWMGSSNSGAPDGIDPFGECPVARKLAPR